VRQSWAGIANAKKLFGGTTQYAVTWLIKVTGNPLMPAWYWTAAMVACVLAAIAARESAPRKLAGAANPSIQLADEIAD
jgi:MHS family proline/betaine transporter-like MFS transporter